MCTRCKPPREACSVFMESCRRICVAAENFMIGLAACNFSQQVPAGRGSRLPGKHKHVSTEVPYVIACCPGILLCGPDAKDPGKLICLENSWVSVGAFELISDAAASLWVLSWFCRALIWAAADHLAPSCTVDPTCDDANIMLGVVAGQLGAAGTRGASSCSRSSPTAGP